MEMRYQLVFGTGNTAKVGQVRSILEPAGVRVVGLSELGVAFDVAETADSLEGNARLKAVTYARYLGRTVFSMDNGLYFDGVAPQDQPSLHLREINGQKRAGDDEALAYYCQRVAKLGGTIRGGWNYAVALAAPDGRLQSTLINQPRLFSSRPRGAYREGYPLESIAIDPATGVCIAEMTDEEQAAYWRRNMGAPLQNFVLGHATLLEPAAWQGVVSPAVFYRD